ncbi:MAG: serine/threonine protein kinase [Naasia sp.]|nr:serine/threonine protein kinase [Naasia sp.]
MTSTWPGLGSGEILGGRYELQNSVGVGGMAEVHRAHDLVLDRDVAVKVFRPELSEANDPRRIEAEMKILGSVNHPNLVTLHDAHLSADGTTAFLVMELVDGEDLAQLIAERRISARESILVCAQVAGALAHIHRRGIVHRDVKPANILVRRDEDGRIVAKLADLGIARIADATHFTTAGTVLGTVSYLSPEQVNGGAIDSATDIYSLGLVLVEALTGRKAFPGTPSESAAARTVRAPDLPSGLREADWSLLAAMTALNPAARVSAAQAEDALRRWAATPGSPTQSSPIVGGVPTNGTAILPVTPMNGTAPITPAIGYPAGIAAPATNPMYPGLAPATSPTQTGANTGALFPGTGPFPTGMGAAVRPPTGQSEAVRAHRKRQRIGIVALVGTALVLIGIIVMLAFTLFAPEPPLSTDYPVVGGEVGELLEDLQRSVEP